jgi:hypothetical protein
MFERFTLFRELGVFPNLFKTRLQGLGGDLLLVAFAFSGLR